MQQQSHSPNFNSSQREEEAILRESEVDSVHGCTQVTKNRRWGQQQHMLFIMFLQENREKIKSKLIRRSNSFFRDMSAFILTKNPTQCRSYHQKYENKYKFPHRIIRQEKEKLNAKLYEQILAKRKILFPNADKQKQPKVEEAISVVVPKREKPVMAVSECQTDIQGVSTILIQPDSGITSPQQITIPTRHVYMNPYNFIGPYYPPYYQW